MLSLRVVSFTGGARCCIALVSDSLTHALVEALSLRDSIFSVLVEAAERKHENLIVEESTDSQQNVAWNLQSDE